MIVLDKDDLQSATELLEDTFGTVTRFTDCSFTLDELDIGLSILVDDSGYVVKSDNFRTKPCNTILDAVQYFIHNMGAV